MTEPMSELRLVFHRDPATGACTVRPIPGWAAPPAAAPADAAPFAFSLTDKEFEEIRWYLEDFMDLPESGSIVRADRVEGQLLDWGRGLYAAAFPPDSAHAGLLAELLALPEPRALTIGTADAGLLRLPWELIADAAGPLANRLSVRRQLEDPKPGGPRAAVLPLRILYVVSRPADSGFLDPRLTTKSVLDALDPLGASVQVDFCRPPTLERMEEMLGEAEAVGDPYDLVHFDGHGTFLPEFQLGALCFEKPDDGTGEAKTDLVRADQLGALLARHQVPLVILEACRSGTVGRTAVFQSVAPRLIQTGIGSVLSMGYAVHVEAARLLLDRFYREAARGATIGQAVAAARAALIAKPTRWIESGPKPRTVELQDWFLPHLYQRGPDAPLVPAADVKTAIRPRRFDVFLSHNHNDSARVERLARLLVEKHGLRVWLDKWEIKGGLLRPQCEAGIVNSRYTVVAISARALQSAWVAWEIDRACVQTPDRSKLLPVRFENIELPADLNEQFWVDFADPTADEANAIRLAGYIRSTDGADARAMRGFRAPAGKNDAGPFPPPPMYDFHGRARELYALERQFRTDRGVLLHAMGGMGKTTLATEAAQWWTRSGLFRDGACFVSFEQVATADRVVTVLGTYLEGPNFEALPAAMQRQRAVELFDEKDVLLVWDNFESVLPQFNADGTPDAGAALYGDDERGRLFDLFRDLTASPKGRGRLLVTCRPGETGLPGAGRMELRGLARPDSLWLVSRVIGKDGLALDNPRLRKDKLGPLLDALADHPLSIELVCPHLRRMTPDEIVSDFGRLLETRFKRGRGTARNESLLASLEFSTARLSPAARAAMSWLGLFRVGVFEHVLLYVSDMDPQVWAAVRDELEATPLVRVEGEVQFNGRPYLRFHPTLAYAASGPSAQPLPAAAGERFVFAYVALTYSIHEALHGSDSGAAMAAMAREETNVRAAVTRVADAGHDALSLEMADVVRDYLERSGRLRERDAWVMRLTGVFGQRPFTEDHAVLERNEAWSLFAQGRPAEAVRRLEGLLTRLRAETSFDPGFELAATGTILGRVYHHSGQSDRAIPVLADNVARWEGLLARADPADDRRVRGGLSAALADHANALRVVGRVAEALAAGRRGLQIDLDLRNDREAAAGLGQVASILLDMGEYADAEDAFDKAIAAARHVGDRMLEAIGLQNQAFLADVVGQYSRAANLYRQALHLLQEMGDKLGVMQTYNLLGVTDMKQDRLAEACAWYENSREIAVRIGHVKGQGSAAQNIGTVRQLEGHALRRAGREADARERFEAAHRAVIEALELFQQAGEARDVAKTLAHLGQIDVQLGWWSEAEQYADKAREVYEQLELPDVAEVYLILCEAAMGKGDTAKAAAWEAKRDAMRAEVALPARGPAPGGVPPQLLEPLRALAVACGQAAANRAALDPGAAGALDALDKMPPPLPELSAFLRRVAGGESPATPGGLPGELAAFLGQLLDAVRAARQS